MNDIEDIEKLSKFLNSLKDSSSDKVVTFTNSVTFPDQSNSGSNDLISTNPRNAEKSEAVDLQTSGQKGELERLLNLKRRNMEYDKKLQFLEFCLLKYLAECRREITTTTYSIERLKNPGSKEHKELVLSRKANAASLHRFTCFPYFKDTSGFPAPANMDTRMRDASRFVLVSLMVPSTHWTNKEKRKLEECILTEILEAKQKMVKFNKKPPFKTSYSGEIDGVLIRNCFKIGSSAEEIKQALCTAVGDKDEEYDWLKISVSDLDGARGAHECRAIWFNYLHPKIKKTEWSEAEEDKLKRIAEENMCQNWEKIAKDLGTGRSAYQCNVYYHFQFQERSPNVWNTEDSMKLQSVVNKMKFQEHIPWNKISYFFDDRKGSHVFRKWVNMFAKIKKGKFSREEDIILCFGLKQCGPKWCEIAEYFPDRRNTQLRGRLHVLQGRDSEGPWTYSDDILLKGLIEKYGWGNWTQIRTHFCNRSCAQIRTRSLSLRRRQFKVDASLGTRALASNPKVLPDSRRISDVLESARDVLERKRIGMDPIDGDRQIMDELSKVLVSHKKRGRKVGQTLDCPLSQQFRNFFFMCSEQRGGRGKNRCIKSAVPDMAFDLIAALTVLEAQIYLPTDEDIIRQDFMPRMDKDVAQYLVRMKEKIQGEDAVIKFVDSDGEMNIYIPISTLTCDRDLEAVVKKSMDAFKYGINFPCTQQNLVGLRALLLNQQNLVVQSKKGISESEEYEFCESPGNEVDKPSISSIVPLLSGPSVLHTNKDKKHSKLPSIETLVIKPPESAGSTLTSSAPCVSPVLKSHRMPNASSSTAHFSRFNSTIASSFPSTGEGSCVSNSMYLHHPSPLTISSPCQPTCSSRNLPASLAGVTSAYNTVSSTSYVITPPVFPNMGHDVSQVGKLPATLIASKSAIPDTFPSTAHDMEASMSSNMSTSTYNSDVGPSAFLERGLAVTAETGSSDPIPNATHDEEEDALATLNESPELSSVKRPSGSLEQDHTASLDVSPSDPSGLYRMVSPRGNTSYSCATSQSTSASTSTASSSCMSSGAELSSSTGRLSPILPANSPTLRANSPTSPANSPSSVSIPPLFIAPEVFNKIQFSHATSLFQKRFLKLFLWPSVFSDSPFPKDLKVEDINADEGEEKIQDDDDKEEDNEGNTQEKTSKRGRRKKRFKEKKLVQNTNGCNAAPNSDKPKRQYVKSGKYSRNISPGQELRKSMRHSNQKKM